MWCRRRCTWHCDLDEVDLAVELAKVLCAELPQNFCDLEVTGSAFGVAEISLTVCDRDQWWVGRRIRLLHEDMRKLAQVTLVDEVRVKLPPHQHPNRSARWRKEPVDG